MFRFIILLFVALYTIYLGYQNESLKRQLETRPTPQECLSVCVEEFEKFGC